MPQETKSVPRTDAPGTLQGWTVDAGDDALTKAALEKAFDYRGDVTITLTDGRIITGYIFDRRRGTALADSSVRLLTAASDEKVRIAYSDIRRIEFSGKDTAHGKSFENWVRKYVEKKLKGEKAGIESENLE
jgi:hypothetical protein